MKPTFRRRVAPAGFTALLAALLVYVACGTEREPAPEKQSELPATPRPAPVGEVPPASRAPQRAAAAPSGVATSSSPMAPIARALPPAAGAWTPQPIVRARWGGAAGELGRKAANESSPEGPMSFEVDARGRSFVLDQVNSRVSVFEPGAAPRSIPLPADTFQDLALTKNDGLVLLDRLTTGSLAYVDRTGKVTHEIGLSGKGVEAGGDVTAVMQRPDGTWVEVKHANLVRIADADGNPVEDRAIVQGRFAADGQSVLRASKSGAHVAFVVKKGSGPAERLARVSFELPLWQLTALESDASGRIFLGAHLLREASVEPFAIEQERELVVVIAANGAELARYEFPPSTGPEESFRRVRVGGDGALYHLGFDQEGATLSKVTP